MPRAFAISFIQCLWSTCVYMITVNLQCTGGISQGWGVTCRLCLLDMCCPWGWEWGAKPSTVAFTTAFLYQLRHTDTPAMPQCSTEPDLAGNGHPHLPLVLCCQNEPQTILLWIPLWIPLQCLSRSQGSLHPTADVPSCQHTITHCCSPNPALDQPWKSFPGLIPVTAAMANLARHNLDL